MVHGLNAIINATDNAAKNIAAMSLWKMEKLMKLAIRSLAAILLMSVGIGAANAGIISFAAGYAVGSSGNHENAKESAKDSIVISSDKYDTIACEANGEMCKNAGPFGGELRPELYIGWAGYKTLHKQAVAIVGNKKYIIMEVSK